MARTDERTFTVRAVTWREWAGFAAGLLALGSLFLPWTTLSADAPDTAAALAELPAADTVRDAWTSGFLAWASSLLVLLAGVTVLAFGQVRAARVAGLPQLWLVAAVVALALAVLGWIGIGWQFGGDELALLDDAGVAVHAGLGRYLGLAATVGSLCVAVLDVRAFRKRFLGKGLDH